MIESFPLFHSERSEESCLARFVAGEAAEARSAEAVRVQPPRRKSRYFNSLGRPSLRFPRFSTLTYLVAFRDFGFLSRKVTGEV
jgi:hypothetical protein